MRNIPLNDKELAIFRKLIYEWAGISMSDQKRSLIASRLMKRLSHYNFDNFMDYINLVQNKDNETERQLMIDILTTNETYFFRERQHFDFLWEKLIERARAGTGVRIWSAASSTGEEAYTLAIVCAETLGVHGDWEIIGTDINETVLQKASQGIYSMDRLDSFPENLLKKYCLKGTKSQEGKIAILPDLVKKVRFQQANLIGQMPNLGMFDFIFLRNVLIYFDNPTKTKVVEELYRYLKPGGYLITGLSESILHLSNKYIKAGASISQKIA